MTVDAIKKRIEWCKYARLEMVDGIRAVRAQIAQMQAAGEDPNCILLAVEECATYQRDAMFFSRLLTEYRLRLAMAKAIAKEN